MKLKHEFKVLDGAAEFKKAFQNIGHRSLEKECTRQVTHTVFPSEEIRSKFLNEWDSECKKITYEEACKIFKNIGGDSSSNKIQNMILKSFLLARSGWEQIQLMNALKDCIFDLDK